MARVYKTQWPDGSGRFQSTLYQRSRVRWSQVVWYGRDRDLFAEKQARLRGRQFELIAVEKLFPSLGLTNVTDLAGIMCNSPFDFLADYEGKRVVIDVTVKWQKRVDAKAPLAEAFGFPFYLLLVSPRDPSFHFFTLVRPDALSIRVPFALLRQMASSLGEQSHGRK